MNHNVGLFELFCFLTTILKYGSQYQYDRFFTNLFKLMKIDSLTEVFIINRKKNMESPLWADDFLLRQLNAQPFKIASNIIRKRVKKEYIIIHYNHLIIKLIYYIYII